jgi:diacylglycerol kinase (CTP)
VTLYLYASHVSPQHVIVALSGSLLLLVPLDILRLHYPPFERSVEKVLGFLMRESEKVRHNPRLMPPRFRISINLFSPGSAES